MKEYPMKHAPLRDRTALAAAILLMLAGCATAPARLGEPALRDDVPLAGLQVATRAGWPDAQGWRQYNDPQHDDLMNRDLRQSPDMALARARVRGVAQTSRLDTAQYGRAVNGRRRTEK